MVCRFELESLKLVFGTSAIKKDGEDIEKNGEEMAPRRKKYYDFSETNVKVDDILSHSPIVKTLLEEEDDDLHDDFLLDKRSKRHYNVEDTHEFIIPAIKEHFDNHEDPAQRNLNLKMQPNYFDSWQHNPRVYFENPRKKVIEKYQKPLGEKPIGLISPCRDEYKAQNLKKDNSFDEEGYDKFYQVRFQNQHKHNDFYPNNKDFYYLEKPQEMEFDPAMYRLPPRERIGPKENYAGLYNYNGVPEYQAFKRDSYGGDSMRNMGNFPTNAPLPSNEEAFKVYPQNNHKSYLVQDQNQQKYLQYYKEQPYFGRAVIGEPRETILYQNQVNEDKPLRVSQIGPNYMGHPNSKLYPYMS